MSAPVTFTSGSGGGTVQKSALGTPGQAVSLLTDGNGQARAYFRSPNTPGSTSGITAGAGSGSSMVQVSFSESTDHGGNTYASPFAPSNGNVVLNSDGSLDITWQNNTDSPADMPISLEQPDHSWKVVATVPAGTTSVHIPPQ